MLKSLVTLTAVCALAASAPFALADPSDDPPPVQPVADPRRRPPTAPRRTTASSARKIRASSRPPTAGP